MALLTGILGLAATSSAFADELDDRVAVARKALVERLETLATWCDQQRVFSVRDEVFRRILTIAPDHARSRTALKYKRESKNAPWVQSPDYRTPGDWAKGLVPEARKKLAESGSAYRKQVMAALDAAGDVKPARRDEMVERLVDLLPDDVDLRRSRGDVESGSRWVLPETVDAATRREDLRAAVSRADGAFTPVPDAASLSNGWSGAWRVADRLVLTTLDRREGLILTRAVSLAETFCSEVLDIGVRPTFPSTILILSDRQQAKDFLRKQGASAETLLSADHASSLYSEKSDLLVYGMDAERRFDGVVTQLAGLYLRERTKELRGWIFAGVAPRLAWHVLGHHPPGFADWQGTDRPVDDSEDEPLPPLKSTWMKAAAGAIDRGGVAGFRTLFTRQMNAFRSADILMAYGLGAYLLEARPESLVAFLAASGDLEDPDEVCQRALSVDADVFYWRLRRWLLEQ